MRLLKLNHLYSYVIIKMELPIEIQNIIHEYAKPVTRPDWKTLHKLPLHRYLGIVRSSYNWDRCPVVLCGLERKIRKIWYSDLYELNQYN